VKQLIGVIGLGALTAASMALYGAAHQQAHATRARRHDGSNKSDRQGRPEGELVLLGLDGTVVAREVNLAQQGSVARR
jgi:hypothetical protein